jgi:hypothetical protein
LDGRKSDNIPDDFYDVVTREFNNEAFTPYSRPLPDLHDDFAEAMPLPLSSDYTMTPEKAKSLIANMHESSGLRRIMNKAVMETV